MKATGWRTLFDGTDLDKWVIAGQDVELDGNTLAVAGGEVRAETGGMSWDNYDLRAEIMITPKGGEPKYCVQLTAKGTCVYCQLVPHCMLIAYYCGKPNKKPRGFTHLIPPAEVTIRYKRWFTFMMKANQGKITGFVDGKEVAAAQVPSGTQGMPGFLVNQQRGCVVRLRNIKIRFLRPTTKQLEEFERHPLFNWLKHKESISRK